MVSDRKKKQAAIKKNASKASLKSESSEVGAAENSSNNVVDTLAAALEEAKLNDRSCTGVLTSHPQSRDIQLSSFGLLYHGHELLADTNLELNYGR